MNKQKYEARGMQTGNWWELNKGLDPSTLIGKGKEALSKTEESFRSFRQHDNIVCLTKGQWSYTEMRVFPERQHVLYNAAWKQPQKDAGQYTVSISPTVLAVDSLRRSSLNFQLQPTTCWGPNRMLRKQTELWSLSQHFPWIPLKAKATRGQSGCWGWNQVPRPSQLPRRDGVERLHKKVAESFKFGVSA